jgi:RcsF protein
MRALPVCLLALMLSGCSMLSRSPVEPVQSTATPPVKSEPSKPRATRPAPVRIYTDASELVGKPFRDLGEVTGESCQASNQDSPPNIPTARKRLQINAANESQCRPAAPLRSDQRYARLLPSGGLSGFSA